MLITAANLNQCKSKTYYLTTWVIDDDVDIQINTQTTHRPNLDSDKIWRHAGHVFRHHRPVYQSCRTRQLHRKKTKISNTVIISVIILHNILFYM